MNVNDEMNPDYEQPAKSGKSWFACFGIGCVILFLLCGVGAGLSYVFMGPQIKMVTEQAQMHVETVQSTIDNEQVKTKLGDNVQPGFAMPTTTPQGETLIQTYAIPVSGSEGEGTLHVEYEMTPGQPVIRTMFNLEVDGEVIDLMGSDDLNLDIDGPNDDMIEDEAPMEEEPVGAGS